VYLSPIRSRFRQYGLNRVCAGIDVANFLFILFLSLQLELPTLALSILGATIINGCDLFTLTTVATWNHLTLVCQQNLVRQHLLWLSRHVVLCHARVRGGTLNWHSASGSPAGCTVCHCDMIQVKKKKKRKKRGATSSTDGETACSAGEIAGSGEQRQAVHPADRVPSRTVRGR
jgi:hypothetical protein